MGKRWDSVSKSGDCDGSMSSSKSCADVFNVMADLKSSVTAEDLPSGMVR